MQNFRRLDVWHRAHTFSLEIQRLVGTLPRGFTDLKSQLSSAADSIPSNIVEGCGAASRKELARYLDISIRSAFEVEYRLQVAHDTDLIDFATWQDLTREVIEIRKMLFTFRRAVLKADQAEEDEKRKDTRARRKRPRRPDARDDSAQA